MGLRRPDKKQLERVGCQRPLDLGGPKPWLANDGTKLLMKLEDDLTFSWPICCGDADQSQSGLRG